MASKALAASSGEKRQQYQAGIKYQRERKYQHRAATA